VAVVVAGGRGVRAAGAAAGVDAVVPVVVVVRGHAVPAAVVGLEGLVVPTDAGVAPPRRRSDLARPHVGRHDVVDTVWASGERPALGGGDDGFVLDARVRLDARDVGARASASTMDALLHAEHVDDVEALHFHPSLASARRELLRAARPPTAGPARSGPWPPSWEAATRR
jgi:hypothetical protein